MRKFGKRLFAFILCVIQVFLMMPFAFAVGNSQQVEVDNISIGAGGSFIYPMIDPTDSDNYIVSSDMSGVYYSSNSGSSWERNNTYTTYSACMSDEGVLFLGSYGLYTSYDNGETLNLIYPQADTVQYTISRYGRNDCTMVADGYDNGMVVAVDTYGKYVYFITINWLTPGNLRFCRCLFDGSELEILFSKQVNISPTDAKYYLIAEKDFVFYSDSKTIWRYDTKTGISSTKIVTPKIITDMEMIGNYLFFLVEHDHNTNVVYTDNFDDFSSHKYINFGINLPNTFTRGGKKYSFEWHFNDIAGNNFNNIWLAFSSPTDIGTIGGVLKFNGSTFEWVYDKIFNPADSDCYIGWNSNGIAPIYGVYADPNDDNHCLMTNIDTVYDVYYNDETNERTVKSLHCTINEDGTYTTSGLDCQATYFVREDPFNKEHIVICSTDIGLQASYNGGKSFRRMDVTYESITNTCYDVYFDENTEGLVYGLWSSRHNAPYTPDLSDVNAIGAFSVSYDGGITWDHNYSTGLPKNSIPVKMSVVPNGDKLTIAVATFNNGFYISYNSGKTFTCISKYMPSYNGIIWGEDVVIAGNSVYCLTAQHNFGGRTPSALYKYDLLTGKYTTINMGDILLARSLTYDKDHGLFVNVTPDYREEWIEEINKKYFVNFGGGVYHLEGNSLKMAVPVYDGAFNSAFTSDGTMYVVSELGVIYTVDNNGTSIYADGLFRRLKNITFSRDEKTLYVTTLGGGTYRMPTLCNEYPVITPTPDNSVTNSPSNGSNSKPISKEYSVTFKDYDGTVINVQNVSEGKAAIVPEAPARKPDINYSYAFSGWDKDTSAVYSNLVVTATYTATAHKRITINALTATCTANGYSGDVKCSDCGTILETGRIIKATGHTRGSYVSNNNSTHNVLCSICKYAITTENCTDTNNDGACDKCNYKLSTPTKLVRSSSLVSGEKYVITQTNSTVTFNYSLNTFTFNMKYSNGGYIPDNLPENIQWTYSNGKLYTIYNGQKYYLTVVNPFFGTYYLTTTTNSSTANTWSYSGGTLSTKESFLHRIYLTFNSRGVSISSLPAYTTVYKIED